MTGWRTVTGQHTLISQTAIRVSTSIIFGFLSDKNNRNRGMVKYYAIYRSNHLYLPFVRQPLPYVVSGSMRVEAPTATALRVAFARRGIGICTPSREIRREQRRELFIRGP